MSQGKETKDRETEYFKEEETLYTLGDAECLREDMQRPGEAE